MRWERMGEGGCCFKFQDLDRLLWNSAFMLLSEWQQGSSQANTQGETFSSTVTRSCGALNGAGTRSVWVAEEGGWGGVRVRGEWARMRSEGLSLRGELGTTGFGYFVQGLGTCWSLKRGSGISQRPLWLLLGDRLQRGPRENWDQMACDQQGWWWRGFCGCVMLRCSSQSFCWQEAVAPSKGVVQVPDLPSRPSKEAGLTLQASCIFSLQGNFNVN